MAKNGRPLTFSNNENIVSKLRKKFGVSQQEMADILGVTSAAISYYEKGKLKINRPIALLCKILLKYPDILKTLD